MRRKYQYQTTIAAGAMSLQQELGLGCCKMIEFEQKRRPGADHGASWSVIRFLWGIAVHHRTLQGPRLCQLLGERCVVRRGCDPRRRSRSLLLFRLDFYRNRLGVCSGFGIRIGVFRVADGCWTSTEKRQPEARASDCHTIRLSGDCVGIPEFIPGVSLATGLTCLRGTFGPALFGRHP